MNRAQRAAAFAKIPNFYKKIGNINGLSAREIINTVALVDLEIEMRAEANDDSQHIKDFIRHKMILRAFDSYSYRHDVACVKVDSVDVFAAPESGEADTFFDSAALRLDTLIGDASIKKTVRNFLTRLRDQPDQIDARDVYVWIDRVEGLGVTA